MKTPLGEKNMNILPNIQFDLSTSINRGQQSVERMSSKKRLEFNPRREENIKVFVRLKPKIGEK